MTGDEFLALDTEGRHDVLEQIASGQREPAIDGLERAIAQLAAQDAAAATGIRTSNTVGEYRNAQAAHLRRMTPEERLLRYRGGRLTLHQASVWESEYPAEVPRINDIPEWRARHLIDVVG
jgi:hypothetical protein